MENMIPKKKKGKGKMGEKAQWLKKMGKEGFHKIKAITHNLTSSTHVVEGQERIELEIGSLLYNLQRIYHYYCNTIEGHLIVDQINAEKAVEGSEAISYNTESTQWRAHISNLLKECMSNFETGQRVIKEKKALSKKSSTGVLNEDEEIRALNENKLHIIRTIRQYANTIKQEYFGFHESRLANTLDELSNFYENMPKPKVTARDSDEEEGSKSKSIQEEDESSSKAPTRNIRKMLPEGILILPTPDAKEHSKEKEEKEELNAAHIKIVLAQILTFTDYYLNTGWWQEYIKQVHAHREQDQVTIDKNPKQHWADVASRLNIMILRLYMQPSENTKDQLVLLLASFAREIRDSRLGRNSEFATALEIFSQTIKSNDASFSITNRFKAVFEIAPTTPETADHYIRNHILSAPKQMLNEQKVRENVYDKDVQKHNVLDEIESFIQNLGHADKLSEKKGLKKIEKQFSQIEIAKGYNASFFHRGKLSDIRQKISDYRLKICSNLSTDEHQLIAEKYLSPTVKR